MKKVKLLPREQEPCLPVTTCSYMEVGQGEGGLSIEGNVTVVLK